MCLDYSEVEKYPSRTSRLAFVLLRADLPELAAATCIVSELSGMEPSKVGLAIPAQGKTLGHNHGFDSSPWDIGKSCSRG